MRGSGVSRRSNRLGPRLELSNARSRIRDSRMGKLRIPIRSWIAFGLADLRASVWSCAGGLPSR
jgi:hypothetical protein